MVQDLLRTVIELEIVRQNRWNGTNILVENETTEDSETTVEGDRLGDGQAAQTERQGHWSQRAQSNDGNTSEKGTAHVEVLVISVE